MGRGVKVPMPSADSRRRPDELRNGQAFRQAILEKGGSRDPMELFIEFRGREPRVDALLRHNGLAA